MVKPNLAFVNFFNETRGRRVVEIRDIKVPLDEDPDRWPEHHADFEKDTIYEIRWPHLPTEGSSSTSGLYEAYILCFGVTMEDLQHEAIGTGFKIPSADVATFKDVGLSPKTKSKSPVSKVSSRGRKLTKVVVEAPVEPPSHSRKKRKSTEEDITRRERSKAFLESLNCSPFVDDSESLVEPAPKESNKSSAASNNDLQVNVLTERRNNSSCRETQNEQSLGGHSKRSTSKGNGSLPELVNSLNCDKTNISKECSTDHERDSSESKSETKARERPSEHISDLRKPDQVKEKTSPLKSVGTSGSKKGSKRKERGRSRSKSESKSKARERPSEHISDHGITGESDQVNEKDSPFEIVGTTSAEKSSKHK
ncbi:mRNA export factor elf1, partial [Frankliniella fusca]